LATIKGGSPKRDGISRVCRLVLILLRGKGEGEKCLGNRVAETRLPVSEVHVQKKIKRGGVKTCGGGGFEQEKT